jgi:hypothetical protein
MGRISPLVSISSSSRRRLARWLVGSPLNVVERDLVLETLAHTHGNRTVSARLLGVSVRTLRNKITEYSAQGIDIPRHESRNEIVRHGQSPHGADAKAIADAAVSGNISISDISKFASIAERSIAAIVEAAEAAD